MATTNTEYEHLTFDVTDYKLKQGVSLSSLANGMDVSVYKNEVLGHMVIELTARLVGSKVSEPPVIETSNTEKSLEVVGYHYIPATWWDHLKGTFKDYLYATCRVRINLRVKTKILEKTKETVEVTHTHVKQVVHAHFCPHIAVSRNAKHVEFLRSVNTDA